jgi:hypothetical protein
MHSTTMTLLSVPCVGILREQMRHARTDAECIGIGVSFIEHLFRDFNDDRRELNVFGKKIDLLLQGKYGKYGSVESFSIQQRLKEDVAMRVLLIETLSRVLGLRWSDSYLRTLHLPSLTPTPLPKASDVISLVPESRTAFDVSEQIEEMIRSSSDMDTRLRVRAQLQPNELPADQLRAAREYLKENKIEAAEILLAKFVEITGGTTSLTLAAAYFEQMAEAARMKGDLDLEYERLCSAVVALMALEGRKRFHDLLDHPAAILLYNK